jgi:hypothetical protein
LIGIAILSLVPVLLLILDVIIDRGAVVEYAGVKIDFSHGRDAGTKGLTVPTNIGVRGTPVTDSGSEQILETLGSATSASVVVVDLEDGHAWWETRLLVLLAGAERLGRPDIIVFVGTNAAKEQQFLGWGRADALLPCITRADPEYRRTLRASRAAAAHWSLVEPLEAAAGGRAPVPAKPDSITGHLATTYQWAFDYNTGLPNELYAERLLQSELGRKIESAPAGSRKVSIVRLQELFQPVLLKEHIDLSWPADRQLSEFLETKADNIAITQDGRYVSLVPKLTLLTESIKAISTAME